MSKRATSPGDVFKAARQHFEKGRFSDARKLLIGLVTSFPRDPGILRMLGAACCECGHFDEGVDYLLRVCEIEPSALDHYNLGKALQLAGRYESALKAHEAGLKLAPGQLQLMQARALTLRQLDKTTLAIAAFEQVLARDPDFVEALTNYAGTLVQAQRFADAATQIARAVTLKPDDLLAVSSLVRMRMLTCDWTSFREHTSRLGRNSRLVGDPFFMMMYLDEPEKLLNATRATVIDLPPQRPARKPVPRQRIKVGYVSADIRNHAMSRLIAGVIEAHNRETFEIVVVSNGPPDDSPGRARIQAAASHFADLYGKPPSQQLTAMDALELDIAIDLMGHTIANSSGAFAMRIAPVQAAFLGYPGTTAIDAMDYIILDPFIATERIAKSMTEKPAILPHCYQPNDPLRPRPTTSLTRAEYGLPETGFVFCSFNDTGKITPDTFAQWMRILDAVEGSVLWLYVPQEHAQANLRSHAATAGIDPARLIFASTLPQPDHLARYLSASLFLDTFPCGAHTTASDALWMGCPVLTLSGNSMPSRVAGSLLTTIGLHELITTTPAAYEATAIALAQNPEQLAAMRAHLEKVRTTTPLFDAARFARDLERAYMAMWERALHGSRPRAFNLDLEA